MNIQRTILGLAKHNNGLFKSKKQKNFLINHLSKDQVFGFANSGYNSCPYQAEWDDMGITEITKITKRGPVMYWARATEKEWEQICKDRQTKAEQHTEYRMQMSKNILKEIFELEEKIENAKALDLSGEAMKAINACIQSWEKEIDNNRQELARFTG